MIKLGVIREGKNPPDKRVPLTPQQCVDVQKQFPNVEIKVESSPVRAYLDEEYSNLGIPVVSDVSDCDILIGVKEVNIEDLIPNKKYLFFSHTYKLQPYNRKLLQAILDRNIQLIDYEVMTAQSGKRLIGFGRYAGIVGCYNGLLAYGKKHNLYNLKPANKCADRKELEQEVGKIKLNSNSKILLTGFGRVGRGAREIINLLNIKEVSASDISDKDFNEPVFAQIDISDYNQNKNGNEFVKSEFYNNPENFESTFPRFLNAVDLYIACHYWDSEAPFLFTREDLKIDDLKTKVIADISCDIDGPVASTIRPSTIADPLYGYNPTTEKECDWTENEAICVMAVDNLPCELPKDASEDFGDELIKNIFSSLFESDDKGIIDRASQTTLNGKLNSHFEYLEDYLAGKA